MSEIVKDGDLVDPYKAFISKSRYARWISEYNRREKWEETVQRYVDFFAPKVNIDAESKQEIFDAIRNHEVMPSMRAIMTAGEALERSNVAGFNCSFIAIDSPRAFDEALYILMCGTGLGFSVEKRYTRYLPEVPANIQPSDRVVVVHDSKEGWAQGYRELVASLFEGYLPKWDIRQIRPEGARLKTFGGRSSGPQPINDLFEFTVKIFAGARGRKISSIECHEIMCMIGSIVVVGGVRRAALISISSLSDDEMRDAKSGEWWMNKPHLALSNNSATHHSKPSRKEFDAEWEALRLSKSGERGIFNLAGAKEHSPERRESTKIAGLNPCLVGSARILTEKGWTTFADAYKDGSSQRIIQDSRVTYIPTDDGIEHPENWKININRPTASRVIDASHVFLTQKDVPVVRVETRSGHSVTLTPDHHIATKNGMVEAGSIKAGEKILITAGPLPNTSIVDRLPESPEEHEAFLMGMIAGDGTFSAGKTTEIAHIDLWGEDVDVIQPVVERSLKAIWSVYGETVLSGGNRPFVNYLTVRDPKRGRVRISSSFLAALLSKKYGFCRGAKHTVPASLVENARTSASLYYVAALAFCDGTVNKYNKVGSSSIRISQSNKDMLRDVQLILLANGISGSLYQRHPARTSMLPDGRGGAAEFHCKANYELIFMMHAHEFTRYVGFLAGHKKVLSESMFVQPSRKKNIYATVTEVVPAGSEDVYCLKEDVNRTLCADGVTMRRCAEILLRPSEFCNLSEVVVQDTDTIEDLKSKVVIATKIGTWQSTLTNFPYLRPEWKENCDEERLLGVSITGTEGHPVINGRQGKEKMAKWLQEMKSVAISTNKKEARRIGINFSASITCAKPSGTVSQIVGVSSGIHPWYAQYFIRRVRASKMDPMAKFLEEAGVPCEEDAYNDKNIVFSYPTAAPEGSITRHDRTAIEQAEMWIAFKENWTEHNPSVTVYIGDEEWEEMADWVYEHFDRVVGMSFIPKEDESHSFVQAPYEEITKEQYEQMQAGMPEINWDFLGIYETDDNTTGSQTLACQAGQCDVADIVK